MAKKGKAGRDGSRGSVTRHGGTLVLEIGRRGPHTTAIQAPGVYSGQKKAGLTTGFSFVHKSFVGFRPKPYSHV